jgi:hypothetical protein
MCNGFLLFSMGNKLCSRKHEKEPVRLLSPLPPALEMSLRLSHATESLLSSAKHYLPEQANPLLLLLLLLLIVYCRNTACSRGALKPIYAFRAERNGPKMPKGAAGLCNQALRL